jgi:hypothetical protein
MRLGQRSLFHLRYAGPSDMLGPGVLARAQGGGKPPQLESGHRARSDRPPYQVSLLS